MGLFNRIEAFCMRSFSSGYRVEMDKLKGINKFQDLATEVANKKGSRTALLAIQDFAYQACKARMTDLKEGRTINLLSGEKAVGAENCLLGQAECMKEIYIQAKGLRHGKDPKSEMIASRTFQQLGELGKLYRKEDELPEKAQFDQFSVDTKEAIFHRFRGKLETWIKERSPMLHREGKQIDSNPGIREARSLANALLGGYYEIDTSWSPQVEWVRPKYENLRAAHEFLQEMDIL